MIFLFCKYNRFGFSVNKFALFPVVPSFDYPAVYTRCRLYRRLTGELNGFLSGFINTNPFFKCD